MFWEIARSWLQWRRKLRQRGSPSRTPLRRRSSLSLESLEERTVLHAANCIRPEVAASLHNDDLQTLLALGYHICDNDDAPPVITVTNPAQNARVAGFPSIIGTVTDDDATPPTLVAMIDGGASVNVALGAGNSFSFAVGALADGVHTVKLTATDADGNVTNENRTFTIDATAPLITLGLAPATDSGTLGDSVTTFTAITLRGTTEPNTSVVLTNTNQSTTSAADGSFQFANVTLPINTTTTFTARATDSVGNARSVNASITQAPAVQPPAGLSLSLNLAFDTGISSNDRITNNATVAGSVTSSNAIITSFRAGLDNTLPANYTNILFDIQPIDGEYLLSVARLQQINGNVPLSNGIHTLHLIAVDSAGASRSENLTFTLDTSMPLTFDFASAFDTGTLGDKITTLATVDFVGRTEPNTSVYYAGNNQTVTSDGNGDFRFPGVAIPLGVFPVNMRAGPDVAGNVNNMTLTFLREDDSFGPALTASLTRDTARDDTVNTDGITFDPSVNGTISDDSGVRTFLAGFDATPQANFIDVMPYRVNGQLFSFNSATIDLINGGPLSQGLHTLHLIATDVNGRVSSLNLPFTFDSLPPTPLTLELDLNFDTGTAGDQLTSLPTVTLTGIAEPGAALKLIPSNQTTTAGANGSFSFAGVSLALGNNSFTVAAQDVAGNPNFFNRTIERVSDTSGPTIAVALANDTGRSNSDRITMDSTVVGSAVDPSFVTLFAGFNGTPTVDISFVLPTRQGGNFTLNQTTLNLINNNVALPDGAFTLQLLGTDALGNSAAANLTFTLDRAAPAAPTLVLANASRTSPGDAFNTSFSTVTLAGTSEANATVTLNPETRNAIADGNGEFSFGGISLVFGNNPKSAFATDVAGNVGPTTNSTFRLTIDVEGPSIAARLANDTGISNTDRITLNGTVAGTIADATGVATFEASVDGSPFQSIVADVSNGAFSLSIARLSELKGASINDGNITVSFRATDPIATNPTSTTAMTFLLDRLAPPVDFNLTPSTDTGTEGDFITTLVNVVLAGATESNTSVTSVRLLSTNQTVVPDSGGNFSFPLALPVGVNPITIESTDRAGNVGSRTRSVTRLDDPNGPSITLSLTRDTARDNAVNNDRITFDPSLNGTVSDISGVATFRAGFDATATADFLDILPFVNPDGTFSLSQAQLETINRGALSQGGRVLHLTASDRNGTSQSVDFNFTFDASAPAATLDLAASSDTFPVGDRASSLSFVTLQGITEPDALVRLQPGNRSVTAAANGSFAFSNFALALGSNNVTLQVQDVAGNLNAFNQTYTRVLDASGPTLVASLANDTGLSNTDRVTSDPTIVGSAFDPSFITLQAKLDGGSLIDITARLPLPFGGNFTLDPAALMLLNGNVSLSQGAHTLFLFANDALGNTANVSLPFTLDTLVPSLAYDLDPASDSGLLGDRLTNRTPVVIAGLTEPNAVVRLGNQTAAAGLDGSFQFANVPLSLGANLLTITSTDLAGNSSSLNQTFTLSNDTSAPVISPRLANDTGASNADKITMDATIAGTIADTSTITVFRAGFDSTPIANYFNILPDVIGANFTLSLARLQQINGGVPLSDGNRTLHLFASDVLGNNTTVDFGFTLDRSLAPSPTFDLANASDTGTVGDHITNLANVTLVGATEPNATLRLSSTNQTTVASGNGSFSFNVTLPAGNAAITIIATDLAGNSASGSQAFSRDSTGPVIVINPQTQPDRVTGTVTDPDSGISTFEAALDNGPFQIVTVNPDGTFDFPINLPTDGSADGEHVIHFRATDRAGNITLRDYPFTWNAAGPFITVTAPPPNSTFDQDFQVVGRVNDGNGVAFFRASLDGSPFQDVAFDANGNFTLQIAVPQDGSADGTHVIQFFAEDVGGKTRTLDFPFAISTIPPVLDLRSITDLITSEAFDPTTGTLYVANYATIYKIDAINGSIIATLRMPGGASNAMQLLTVPMTLAGVSIPAGTLLVYNGGTTPDRIYAINPANGVVLAQLDLPSEPNNGVGIAYNDTTSSIFLLVQGTNQVIELNPANGAVLSSFAAPFTVNFGGLAVNPIVNPANGKKDLWIASSSANVIVRVSTGGTVFETIDLSNLGSDLNISGLAFQSLQSDSSILIATVEGIVYKILLV